MSVDDEPPRVEGLRILVVDDTEADAGALRHVLTSSGFAHVAVTTDPAAVEACCDAQPPDLVLLDLDLRAPGGLAVLERLQPRIHAAVAMPVIVLAGPETRDERRTALEAGARDFLTKPYDAEEVLLRVRNQLELRAVRLTQEEHDREMEDRQRSGLVELEAARLEVVERLARAGEFRDDETGEHTRRVGRTAERLALATGIDPIAARAIGLAAPLHDIGKIAIPDAILLRRGRLTGEEVRMMQRHTVIGAQILDGSSSTLLNLARDIALTHHERWDGGGYPSGFGGEDIPLGGRLVAIADVFDALTHERPYKDAWAIRDAVAEIASQTGRQFDPALVTAFLSLDHAALV
jgi:putative two-component system response regulator